MDKEQLNHKAMNDSAKGTYDPPNVRPLGPIGTLMVPFSDKEIAENRDYREMWRSNKDNIEKQR